MGDRFPLHKQVPNVNKQTFARSLNVAEVSAVTQCLMDVRACVNGNVSLQSMVDIGARCNVVHEHIVRKVGEIFMAPPMNLLEQRNVVYIPWL